jgi:anaerobic dimethyl sulfoxide reductase subunit B (iron-sulfur subunit)
MTACPVEAISKSNENGLVRVDEESCTGCQVCSDVCPFGVPQFDEASGIMGKCDLCLDQQLDDAALPCIATCPNQALSLKWVTVEEKRELEGTLQQALR